MRRDNAKATGRCWSAGGKRGRDTHGRGPGASGPERKGKKLSNTDWVSKSDPEADHQGRTARRIWYKPEHAVDLDTGAVVAAELHPADEGERFPRPSRLEAVDAAPSEDPARRRQRLSLTGGLEGSERSPWKTRIAAPKQTGFSRWHGDEAARRAVTNNRARSSPARPSSCAPRSSSAALPTTSIVAACRTWLRGRENVHKRYLLHVAGSIVLMRHHRRRHPAGGPGGYGGIFVLTTGAMLSQSGQTAFAAAFLIWDESRKKINGLISDVWRSRNVRVWSVAASNTSPKHRPICGVERTTPR